jgi:hypothetical protein
VGNQDFIGHNTTNIYDTNGTLVTAASKVTQSAHCFAARFASQLKFVAQGVRLEISLRLGCMQKSCLQEDDEVCT